MELADWVVLGLFFILLLSIGIISYQRVKNSGDFFVAGGKLPWWLAGVSHHVSGYSGVVFVGYASLAYTHGFSIYIWWALTVAIGTFVGAFLIAPRWAELREKSSIQSPTEYLANRYNLPTQQLIAWSGVLLKLFDIGAKWAAIAILLNGFTGLPFYVGIWLAGGISLMYLTLGGLWADTWNDFAQFVVQIIAGITMLVIIIGEFGGVSETLNAWERLPSGNQQLFNEPYTIGFALSFLFINFLSYNGGTWNLAMRYISSPSGANAKKAAILSSLLYLIWPLILFVPMWMAPILLPDLVNPETSYAVLAKTLLPNGLIGLVLAGMFANTITMTASDSNTVSSVITRDILPVLSKRFKNLDAINGLRLARFTTFSFTFLTLLIGLNSEAFGGVLGLIISWFGALVGPVAIPILFGLLPVFRHSDAKAAIVSIIGGFLAFVLTKYYVDAQVIQLAAPISTAFVLYTGIGYLNKWSK